MKVCSKSEIVKIFMILFKQPLLDWIRLRNISTDRIRK